MGALEQYWPDLLAGHADLRDRLAAAYAEPHRGYHDTRHLLEVLGNLERLMAEHPLSPAERDAVVLAAWFHDAVYDGSRDDEERSAAWAEDALTAAGAPVALVADVARLVRLTAEHRPTADDLLGQLLSDADLAVLAAGPDRYAEYVRGVRAEYAELDEVTFRTGRERVLGALLEKPTLFHTGSARAMWEDAARRNVARELSAPGSP